MVDNNILGSRISVWTMSHGGAFVHNLFAGVLIIAQEKGRYTPYHLPHRTDVAGLSIILNGDDRFYNNLFMPVDPDAKYHGKPEYSKDSYPSFADGNAYYNRAAQLVKEEHFVSLPDLNTKFEIEEKGKEVYVSFSVRD